MLEFPFLFKIRHLRIRARFIKSKVFGTSASATETSQWANILGCEAGTMPFKYLGVTIGANMNQAKYWTPIIEKFQSKLSGWKSRTLSFGGRLTLVKAVLGNLPTYFMSLFRAPKRVVESLEKIRRRFLWGGSEGNRKINWVSWEKVTSPKEHGGLGIGSIRSLNIALLIKWWWRLNKEPKSLWARVISGIHNLRNKPMAYLHKKKIAGVWGNIANIKNDIEELGIGYNNIFKKSVKSRTETQFWRDYWVGNTTLKEKYPGLYELERKKSCSVAERIGENGFTGRWYVCPSSAGLSVQYNLLLRDIANTTPSNGEDQFRCTLAPDGDYCVGLMRSRIENKSITNAGELRISWGKTVPIKVSAFVWRANMGRIPSAIELNRRGLKLGSTYCSSCISGDECCDHLLVKCPYATMVRNMIFQWCNIIRPQMETVGDLIQFAAN